MKKWIAMLLAMVTLLLFIPSAVMAEEVTVPADSETVIEQSETVPGEDELLSEIEQAVPQDDSSDEVSPESEPEKEEVTPEPEPEKEEVTPESELQKDEGIPEQEEEGVEEDQTAPQQDPSDDVSDEGEPEEASAVSTEENDSDTTEEAPAADEPTDDEPVPEEVTEPEQDSEKSDTEEVQAEPEQDLSDDPDKSEPVKEETAPAETPAEKAPALRAPEVKDGWVQEDGEWHYYENGVAYTGWAKDSRYWYYCEDGRPLSDGAYYIGDYRYGFASDGHMLTGWQKIWGDWFYFNADGTGKNGWVKDSKGWCYCYNGYMYYDGVFTIDGVRYAFDESGHMVTGWYSEVNQYYDDDGTLVVIGTDWFYFDSDGKGHTGWVQDGKYWWYFYNGNPYKDGFYYIDGDTYAFNSDCHMVTGWYAHTEYYYENGQLKDKEVWYYFDSNGKGHNGWAKDSKYWYYCQDGSLIRDTRRTIDNDMYAFDEEGHMVIGWYTETYHYTDENGQDVEYSNNYYFGNDGKAYTGWVQDGQYWCYFSNGYQAKESVRYIGNDSTCYAFDADGHMVTGWYSRTYRYYDENDQLVEETEWYYFDSNGKGHNGWAKDSQYRYYCDNGSIYRDGVYWIEEEETYYAFDANGHIATGWYADKDWYYVDGQRVYYTVWYYFDSDGKGHNGWVKDSKNWYYCRNGSLCKGTMMIDEVRYAFDDSDGHMLTGWYEEDWGDGTDWFYFDSDGKGHNGYVTSGGKKYYTVNGYMLHDCVYDCDGECRQIGSDGVVGNTISGWKKYGDTWYYANSDGTTYDGWLKSGGKWYYIDKGWMVNNDVYKCKDGKLYAFDKDGVYLTAVTGFYDFTAVYNNPDGTTRQYKYKYYANSDGTPYNGWLNKDGKWYYVNNSYVPTDTAYYIESEKATYGFASDGHMVTGWHKVVHEYYDENDELVKRTYWYYFDSNGKGHNGWLKSNGYWYYLDDGYMYKDTVRWFKDERTYYGFDSDGHMVTNGWVSESYYYYNDDGTREEVVERYYFGSDGKAYTGWADDGQYKCYCRNGRAYSNGVYSIDDVRYAFDSDGHIVTGWYSETDWYYDENDQRIEYTQWYYFDSDGKGHNGWVKDGKYWCYCANGRTYTNETRWIDGAEYAFDSNAHMVTGWYSETGWYYDENDQRVDYTDWYYFDSDGKGHNGWLKENGNWYYFSDGYMYTGLRYVYNDNAYYYFDSNGRMVTGWVYIDPYGEGEKDWYCFDSNGKAHNGLVNDSAHTYYCDDNGRIVRNSDFWDGDVHYYCDANGYATVVED